MTTDRLVKNKKFLQIGYSVWIAMTELEDLYIGIKIESSIFGFIHLFDDYKEN